MASLAGEFQKVSRFSPGKMEGTAVPLFTVSLNNFQAKSQTKEIDHPVLGKNGPKTYPHLPQNLGRGDQGSGFLLESDGDGEGEDRGGDAEGARTGGGAAASVAGPAAIPGPAEVYSVSDDSGSPARLGVALAGLRGVHFAVQMALFFAVVFLPLMMKKLPAEKRCLVFPRQRI